MSNEEYRVYYEFFKTNKPSFPFVFYNCRHDITYEFEEIDWNKYMVNEIASLEKKNVGFLKALKAEYFKIEMSQIINEGENK